MLLNLSKQASKQAAELITKHDLSLTKHAPPLSTKPDVGLTKDTLRLSLGHRAWPLVRRGLLPFGDQPSVAKSAAASTSSSADLIFSRPLDMMFNKYALSEWRRVFIGWYPILNSVTTDS